jgi:wyosine [tRNA(Phe)-imidazoG37] synthetase (radical SAM superfamily)
MYCQLGKTINILTERREFVSIGELEKALDSMKGTDADYATFSGMGEPTLASNLGEAIELVKTVLKLPIAVLTNSTLMTDKDVRRELGLADVVVAKVDAPNEELFHEINRPFIKQTLAEILKALRLFREEYQGKLALQMMFVEANKGHAVDMANIAGQLAPDEIQINTPLRPSGASPLSPDEIAAIAQEFSSLKNVFTVYGAPKPEASPFDLPETLRRRPKL